MKYLGVDYGTKKIGVALSDDAGSIAFPHSVLPNDDAVRDTIDELLEQERITTVVIGHSLTMSGEENPVMEEVHGFKEALERDGFTVYLEPEFLTTQQAKRATGDMMADASAAALILQTFLDKQQTN